VTTRLQTVAPSPAPSRPTVVRTSPLLAATGSARPAGPGFFPLDEELALLPGSLTPRLQEALARLSTQQPSFAKAAAELAFFTGATVQADTARRRTEAAGAVLLAHETAEARRILREPPTSPPGPATLVFGVDGAMVAIVGGQWMEVRTLAVGAVQPPRATLDGLVIQTTEVSYFSRLTDSTTFADLAVLELHRRGIETAQRVGAVVDGAEWCQTFIDYHYGEAVRILDHPHAAEHITLIGQATTGAGPLLSAAECARLRHDLKQKGPDGVLAELRVLVAAHPELPEVAKPLAYLEKRQAQMLYPQFVAEGWPVGSGMVESGNKLVVEERLKGAGRHWVEGNVNPMLALRNAWCNERWEEAWMVSEREQRREVVVRRHQRRARRTPAPAPVPAAPPVPVVMRSDVPAAPPPAPATKPPHPWKRAWSIRRQRTLADAA
jgi:hypothetical protein